MRPLAFLALVTALTACRAGDPRPEPVLAAYLGAIAAGRLDDAYALLSSEYKRTHDRAAFERSLTLADRQAASDKLRSARVVPTAEVELPEGDRVPLVLERGEWRFQRDPLDFYPQRTPEESLRSFIRAVENRRYDVCLRFVPLRYRTTLTTDRLRERWEGEKRKEMNDQLAAARARLGEPFELDSTGDTARLTVGERKQARLVREDGVWKVDALE